MTAGKKYLKLFKIKSKPGYIVLGTQSSGKRTQTLIILPLTDFRCAIEARHEIRSDFIVVGRGRRSKVAKLQKLFVFGHLQWQKGKHTRYPRKF